jgi:Leucine-rich repeat (LRR) protein
MGSMKKACDGAKSAARVLLRLIIVTVAGLMTSAGSQSCSTAGDCARHDGKIGWCVGSPSAGRCLYLSRTPAAEVVALRRFQSSNVGDAAAAGCLGTWGKDSDPCVMTHNGTTSAQEVIDYVGTARGWPGVQCCVDAEDFRDIWGPSGVTQIQSLCPYGRGVVELDLSGCGLHLHESLAQLPLLQVLQFDGNRATSVPPFIGMLRHLTSVSFNDNLIATVSPAIGLARSLVRLHLSGNKISGLPTSVGNLTKVTELEIDRNRLANVPSSIVQMSQLYRLNVANNRLSKLPHGLGETCMQPQFCKGH